MDIKPILHNVFKVKATAEANVLILDVDLSDINGERYECEYVSRSDDQFGLGPAVREWLRENEGSYEIEPYVPYVPTIDEIRGRMEPVSPMQLRLALIRNGYLIATVEAAINSLPVGAAKDEAAVKWEYATSFNRLDPTLLTIATALGITPEKVDAMWATAAEI